MSGIARRVLLIGWDAADWKIISALTDEGLMPAMESLINRGVVGNIATMEPPFSPVLWTSIATGMRADKHGILGFTEPADNKTGMRPVQSTSRKVKAIWNILNQNHLKPFVVNWWPSHPAEPIDGIMVSNFFKIINAAPEKWTMPEASVHPKELYPLFSHLRVHPSELSAEHILPFVPEAAKIDQQKDKRIYAIAKNIAETASVQAAITWILENNEWDFAAVYYDAIDHFCHGFMKYHPPKLPWISEEDFNLFKDVIKSAYRFMDMTLHRLLQLAGSDTVVMLVSDHGYHSGKFRKAFLPYEPAGPAREHRELGIFCAAGPGIKKDERIYGASLLDIAPTILTIFGLPVGKDMDGKPMLQIFDKPVKPAVVDSWEGIQGNSGQHADALKTSPLDDAAALQQLIALGYIEEMKGKKEKIMEKTTDELNYNLARVYLGSEKYHEACKILQPLAEKYPDQSRIIFRLIKCLAETFEYERALRVLEDFEKTNQHFILTNEEIKALHEKEKAEEKIKTNPKGRKHADSLLNKVRRATQAREDAVTARFIKADILLRLNKLKETQEILEELNRQLINSPQLWLQKGNLCLRMRKNDEAAEAFRKVLEIDEENAQAYQGLSLAFYRKREYEKAAEFALESVGIMFYNALAHFYLGEALFKLREYEHAAKAYQTALKIKPGLGAARNKLLKIYEKYLPDKEALDRLNTNGFLKKENDALAGIITEITPDPGDNFIAEKPLHPETIVVVSGLPRSGTSLMMQMLEAGGIPVFTDDKRPADINNPNGYYEHSLVKTLRKNKSWLKLAKGKAVKIISPLLHCLPARYNYKVIFMERSLQEIIASQEKMLHSEGKKLTAFPGQLLVSYAQGLKKVKSWLGKKPNFEVLYINHQELIYNTENMAKKVSGFLGLNANVEKMIKVVDKNLHRIKK